MSTDKKIQFTEPVRTADMFTDFFAGACPKPGTVMAPTYNELVNTLQLAEALVGAAVALAKLDKHQGAIDTYSKAWDEIKDVLARARGEA